MEETHAKNRYRMSDRRSCLQGAAQAQNVHVTPPNALVSEAVRVPAGSEMIYIAGQLPDPVAPGTPAKLGDTKTQTISVLTKIQTLLKEQGYALSDVVMMRVVLVGDPAKGGAMDFAGMNQAMPSSLDRCRTNRRDSRRKALRSRFRRACRDRGAGCEAWKGPSSSI